MPPDDELVPLDSDYTSDVFTLDTYEYISIAHRDRCETTNTGKPDNRSAVLGIGIEKAFRIGFGHLAKAG
jgi:hypothetical protein